MLRLKKCIEMCEKCIGIGVSVLKNVKGVLECVCLCAYCVHVSKTL